MEEEFIKNQERLKPQEEKQEVRSLVPFHQMSGFVESADYANVTGNVVT